MTREERSDHQADLQRVQNLVYWAVYGDNGNCLETMIALNQLYAEIGERLHGRRCARHDGSEL